MNRTEAVPLVVDEWAYERAGDTGEEGEHSLFDHEDTSVVTMQVWNDTADDDGRPLVGLWGSTFANGPPELRRDFSPDQALDLAAMLIVQAQYARAQAIDRALDLDGEN